MFKNNRQLNANIRKIDELIGEITQELINETDEHKQGEKTKRIDELTEIRAKLVESKVNASYSKELITGAFSLAGIVLVLKYEEADIITSKAYSMATKMFRGV